MKTSSAPPPHESTIALAAPLFDQPLMGVALFDTDWACIRANAAWTAATATQPPPSTHLFDLVPELKPVFEPLLSALADEGHLEPKSVQLEINGRPACWTIAIQPLQLERNLPGWIFLLQDRSEDFSAQQQLEQRLADRTQKLSTLYEVMTATAGTADLRPTLQWSLQRVLAAVKCRAGALQLIDDFDEDAKPAFLRLVAQQGFSPAAAAALEGIPCDSGLTGPVMSTSEPVFIASLAANPAAPLALKDGPLQTFVAVPMRVRERVVGVLTVLATAGRRFGDIELALLDSVADQIGIVVENAYLHKQAEEAAVVAERHRLARELHDSVTQAIYSLTLFAEAGLRLVRSGNRALAEECLLRLNETSQKALREMRLMLHKLRPLDLEAEGLIGAIQQRLEEVETRANIEARLVVEGDIEELPEAVEEQLYRIAQEALNNALKHSNASLLTIRLTAEGEGLELEISDNGRGFEIDRALSGGGMGLQNIEERVSHIEGDLAITTSQGEGTTISVHVDLSESESPPPPEPLF